MYSESDERLLFNGLIALDVRTNRLEAGGRAVHLSAAAARILVQLGCSPKVLLRRHVLVEEGWGKYGLEVRQNGLNQVIHELRIAFAQLDEERRYIKTMPRLGYVFLADVVRIPVGASTGSGDS